MKVPLVINHTPSCRWRGQGHSDAAKRISDSTQLHKAALGWDATGRFIACRLSDGKGGGTLYDSYRDAVRDHPNESDLYLYVRLMAEGMTVCDAELYLWVNRQAHDSGFRLTDPDDPRGGRTLIPRIDTGHNLKIGRALHASNRRSR